jgi:hypothetical protein
MWISGAVLVIGISIFLGVFFGGGSSQDATAGAPPPVVNPLTGNVDNEKVPASPEARSVARTFLETAVARKHLDVAYSIVGPWLKGESRAEWITGNNPVQPFPGRNLKTAPFKVLSSTKNALLLQVGPLVPKTLTKGLRPLSFKLEVDRLHGKWLVNYFMPEYAMQRQATPGAGLGGN